MVMSDGEFGEDWSDRVVRRAFHLGERRPCVGQDVNCVEVGERCGGFSRCEERCLRPPVEDLRRSTGEQVVRDLRRRCTVARKGVSDRDVKLSTARPTQPSSHRLLDQAVSESQSHGRRASEEHAMIERVVDDVHDVVDAPGECGAE